MDLRLDSGIKNIFELTVLSTNDDFATTGKETYMVNERGFNDPNLIVSEIHKTFDLNDDCNLKCRLKGFSENSCKLTCNNINDDKLNILLSKHGFSKGSSELFGTKDNSFKRESEIKNFLKTWYVAPLNITITDFIDFSDYTFISLISLDNGVNTLIQQAEDLLSYEADRSSINIEIKSIIENNGNIDVSYILKDGIRIISMSDHLKLNNGVYYFNDFKTYSDLESDNKYLNSGVNNIFNHRIKYNETFAIKN